LNSFVLNGKNTEIVEMIKNWILKEQPDANVVLELQNQTGLSEAMCRILCQKGIFTREALDDYLTFHHRSLASPYAMKNMLEAVDVVVEAIENKSSVMVYGDYDVDGTTAVVLMSRFLIAKGCKVTMYQPDRYAEGYGISEKGVEEAIGSGIKYFISLDCGISSVKELWLLRQAGITAIVCDHHLPGAVLPDAIILNPKQPGCGYPYKELSGCGVGFKLVHALCDAMHLSVDEYMKYVDLVALSIAADIVPVTGENRTLAALGIKLLQSGKGNPGLTCIMDAAAKRIQCTIEDLVFTAAPRINAAGRLAHASIARNALMAESQSLAMEYVNHLNLLNTERKGKDQSVYMEALQMLEDTDPKIPATVLGSGQWSKGVVGIVASRLIEDYYRPAIIFSAEGDFMTGSARTIDGFSLYDALSECAEHVEKFGGHAHAAGITLHKDKLEAFTRAFYKAVEDKLGIPPYIRRQEADLEIAAEEINLKLADELLQIEPCGPGNMKPVFLLRNLTADPQTRKLSEGKHLKIVSSKPFLDLIAFGMGHLLNRVMEKPFDVLAHIEINEFRNNRNVQLRVLDIR
jgi:single-stranded-DNA-specific exonuclease